MEYWITVWMKRNVKQWMEDVIKELLEAVDQSFRTVLITTMNQQPWAITGMGNGDTCGM